MADTTQDHTAVQAHLQLDTAAYDHDAVISSVASHPLRDVLTGYWNGMGDLACQALELQLKLHRESRVDIAEETNLHSGSISSLFQISARSVGRSLVDSLDQETDLKAIDSLPPAPFSRAFGEEFEKLSYITFCRSSSSNAGSTGQLSTALQDIDVEDWVMHNESYMRKERGRDWRWGLVKLSSDCDFIFPSSKLTKTERTISRPEMTGKLILDLKKAASLSILPSMAAYISTFDRITDGLLKGLEWSNVFVAGGIALAALLCIKAEDVTKYESSDIDMYIYGLGPLDANKKLQHIHHVWKSNLPAGSESRVLRNSRTITFLSAFPTKRVQIVLKLVASPKEVLLNFDLDPCSMGFDGFELWMLPRAARALLTGYTVFTMDLVHGHYLGQRRATQQQRVFKYADKGFGIRFLPSYIDSLPTNSGVQPSAIANREYMTPRGAYDVDVVRTIDFDNIMKESRQWTRRWIEVQGFDGKTPINCRQEELTDARSQNSTDPARRSALQNFARFMRHVALWEHACCGDVILDNTTFAYSDYTDLMSPIGYDEGPHYSWSSAFQFTDFKNSLDLINQEEVIRFNYNLQDAGTQLPRADGWDWNWMFDYSRRNMSFRSDSKEPPQSLTHHISTVQRMKLASTLNEVMSPLGDSRIAMIIPRSVMDKCNQLILEALGEHGLPASEPPVELALKGTLLDGWVERAQRKALEQGLSGDYDVPIFWNIDSVRAWQQIDRRIDEAYEILWALRAANAIYKTSPAVRATQLATQLSRRAIRETTKDEFSAFAQWIGKVPLPILGKHYRTFYDGEYDSDDYDQTW